MIKHPKAVAAMLKALGFEASAHDGKLTACWDFDCVEGQEQEDTANEALARSSELLSDCGLQWADPYVDNDSVSGEVVAIEEPR